MYNDRMKAQGYSDKAGTYTANGFVPTRERVTVDSDNGSGCLSSLLTIGIIVLIASLYFVL